MSFLLELVSCSYQLQLIRHFFVFSSLDQGSRNDEETSLNFSQTQNATYNFTVNLDSTGDAIIPTSNAQFSATTPFALIKRVHTASKTVVQTQPIANSASLNLQTIGQELDKVQIRLATSNKIRSTATLTSSVSSSSLLAAKNESSKHHLADPLLSSSSIKSSHSSSNLKSLMNMDETVSSINSSNVTTSSSTSSFSKKASKTGKEAKKTSAKYKNYHIGPLKKTEKILNKTA